MRGKLSKARRQAAKQVIREIYDLSTGWVPDYPLPSTEARWQRIEELLRVLDGIINR